MELWSKNHHNFIDGFHTGYNLEALNIIKNELSYKGFNKNIELGLSFYKTNFIEVSGPLNILIIKLIHMICIQ